jgi:hypothetical protein
MFINYRRTTVAWALNIFQNLTQHGYDGRRRSRHHAGGVLAFFAAGVVPFVADDARARSASL